MALLYLAFSAGNALAGAAALKRREYLWAGAMAWTSLLLLLYAFGLRVT